MTAHPKVLLVIGALAFANLAIWGVRQFEAHLWLHELARAFAS